MSLINKVAAALDISKKDAKATIKAVTNAISEEVAQNKQLTIVGFGSFKVKPYKRTSTLNKVAYPVDKMIVRFKAGKPFDKAVNS